MADQLQGIEADVAETARRMLGFKGAAASSDLEVEFGFADPSNPHSALRLLCRQDGLVLPAESLGAGEQSALVVGLFEAFRQRGTALNTVLLEEPEMYLHPQAQRYFRSILVDLVDNKRAQVIVTTHSPIFANVSRFAELRVLRRRPTRGASNVSYVKAAADISYLEDQLQREKLSQYIDARNAELLFARAVLLVEGYGDRLAAQHVARTVGLDLDAEGLTVVGCGGKNGVPFFARLCRSLEIPFVILHDSDTYSGEGLEDWMVKESRSAVARNEAIRQAAGPGTEIFTLEPSLEAHLGIGRSASDKPQRVLAALEALEKGAIPAQLWQAVNALRFLSTSPAAPTT